MTTSASLPFSRRLILLGSVALASTRRARAAPLHLPRKVRIAIAGFDGHAGEILRMLPSTPEVELTAVADAGSDHLAWDAAGKDPFVQKARSYSTLETLLSSEKLDLVAICNNDGERASAILACLDRNLNVIAEKPLAIDR
ncbi:MAG: Gfo/Idh/MocA family oxidoreductase, partial [Acidobacteriota bacterium]|nr:Gfo/Idh/MocA family oxidoreductase [Acidobacteriota bacterium]